MTTFSSDEYPDQEPEQEKQKDNGKKSHNSEKTNGKDRKPLQDDADIIVKLASDVCKELFRDQFESPYAAMTVNGRTELPA